MAFAEALAAGLPVVAARAGAVPDVVPESARMLVPPDDTRALTEALRQLLSDTALCQRLRDGARQAAANLPRWSDTAAIIASALEEIAREGSSGFSVDWLDLRESADRRARDNALLVQAKQWLQGNRSSAGPTTVVDLGAGTGSTLRAFNESGDPESDTPHWRLVDQDEQLLTEARRRHGGSQSVETCKQDLANISDLPLGGARLVTASALFDLVSTSFIDALATALQAQCPQHPVGLYAALSYNGTTQWSPAHPFDDVVLAAFNRDQQRDKGLGPALGPKACDYLEQQLVEMGFKVSSASSPWILDGADNALVTALIQGVANAVADDPAIDSKSLRDWLEFRQANVNGGSCIVGHTDLLALPVDHGVYQK